MWSHYADYHNGICLRFRAIKHWNIKEEDEYYLEFDYSNPLKALQLVKNELEICSKPPFFNYLIPSRNIFYELPFSKVEYGDTIPERLNMFETKNYLKLYKFLINKFSEWTYENEYRMVIFHGVDEILQSIEAFEKGLVTYQKEDLKGIIFGLNIDQKNAELVYATIKKNFLDSGIPINFYKTVEIEHEYKLEIERINNIEMYINERLKSTE